MDTNAGDDLMQHAAWLRRLAGHLVRADGDDAVQDTYEAALRAGLDPQRPTARAWLAEVLRNVVRRRARTAGRRRAREARADSDRPPEAPSPAETAERLEQQRLLLEIVGALAEPYRTTVVMRYFEEKSSVEIAAALSIPEGTVRWRLKEALARLRTALDKRHGDRRRWVLALTPWLPEGAAAPAPWLATTPAFLAPAAAAVLVAGVVTVSEPAPPPPDATLARATSPARPGAAPKPDRAADEASVLPPAPEPSQAVVAAPEPAQAVVAAPEPARAGTSPPPESRQPPRRRPTGVEPPTTPPPATLAALAPAPPDAELTTGPAQAAPGGTSRPWRATPRLPPPPALADVAEEEAPPTPRSVVVEGQVVDRQGRPVPQVNVFAVPAGQVAIAGRATSDEDGRFRFVLPPHRHDFGLMSSRWLLAGLDRRGPGALRLEVRPVFPEQDPLELARRAAEFVPVVVRPVREDHAPAAEIDAGEVLHQPSIGVLEGRVVDEAGRALAGVRILAVETRSKRLAAATESDLQGGYRLVTRAGPHRLIVHAPGLKLAEARRKPKGLEFVLGVDTQFETVTVRSGRRLSFKVNDSIDPAVVPPQAVMATLRFDYGIDATNASFCPGDLTNAPSIPVDMRFPVADRASAPAGPFAGLCADTAACPVSVWQRTCKLPRFWWLRILQLQPPPPALRESWWWLPYIQRMQIEDAAAAKREAVATGP